MKAPKANKPLSLYWWMRDHGNKRNFGDDMSQYLLEYATSRPVRFAEPEEADVIGLGSILQLFCSRKKAARSLVRRAMHFRRLRPVVWGSGTTGMDATGTMALTDFVPWHLDVRALRGPATTEKLGVRCDVFGDPALLASRIWPAPSTKTHQIGIMPHYTDMDSSELEQVKHRFPQAKIISVENEVDQVVREIASCEVILSSSLHGLIVADSFAIPNYRLVLRGQLTGGSFKFRDYADGIGRPDIEPVSFEGDKQLLSGNFDYQKDLDRICERLLKSISDLAE